LTAALEVVKVAVVNGAAIATNSHHDHAVDHGFAQGHDVPEIEISF
jgi:hypothetical protein